MVTADSILSPAQSAGSACASEVEAVPSGATVGPKGLWGKGGLENSVMPLRGKNSSRERGWRRMQVTVGSLQTASFKKIKNSEQQQPALRWSLLW